MKKTRLGVTFLSTLFIFASCSPSSSGGSGGSGGDGGGQDNPPVVSTKTYFDEAVEIANHVDDINVGEASTPIKNKLINNKISRNGDTVFTYNYDPSSLDNVDTSYLDSWQRSLISNVGYFKSLKTRVLQNCKTLNTWVLTRESGNGISEYVRLNYEATHDVATIESYYCLNRDGQEKETYRTANVTRLASGKYAVDGIYYDFKNEDHQYLHYLEDEYIVEVNRNAEEQSSRIIHLDLKTTQKTQVFVPLTIEDDNVIYGDPLITVMEKLDSPVYYTNNLTETSNSYWTNTPGFVYSMSFNLNLFAGWDSLSIDSEGALTLNKSNGSSVLIPNQGGAWQNDYQNNVGIGISGYDASNPNESMFTLDIFEADINQLNRTDFFSWANRAYEYMVSKLGLSFSSDAVKEKMLNVMNPETLTKKTQNVVFPNGTRASDIDNFEKFNSLENDLAGTFSPNDIKAMLDSATAYTYYTQPTDNPIFNLISVTSSGKAIIDKDGHVSFKNVKATIKDSTIVSEGRYCLNIKINGAAHEQYYRSDVVNHSSGQDIEITHNGELDLIGVMISLPLGEYTFSMFVEHNEERYSDFAPVIFEQEGYNKEYIYKGDGDENDESNDVVITITTNSKGELVARSKMKVLS